jgi:hypothetical protein
MRHQAVMSPIRRTHQDTTTKPQGDASHTSQWAALELALEFFA